MAGKRLIDLIGALAGLAVAIIPMALIAVAVAAGLGRPVLFRQPRIGQAGRQFEMLKFRTMTEATDANGSLLPDEDRTPAIGHVLRRFRLDELPELLTILKGDMSLVGPRPLPVYILAPYLETAPPGTGDKRAEMPPGLTGYAQVCGGTLLTMDEKLALDDWYVDNWSLGLDFWIMARTLSFLLAGERRDEARIKQALASA